MNTDALLADTAFVEAIVGKVKEILVQPLQKRITHMETEIHQFKNQLQNIRQDIDILEHTTASSIKESGLRLTTTIADSQK